MLSRGAVRSLLDRRLRPPPLGWNWNWNWNPSSAMPPLLPPPSANRACLCSSRFAHSTARCGGGESGRTLPPPGKPVFLDLGGAWTGKRRFAPSGALSLRGSSGWQDGGAGGSGEFKRRVDGEAAAGMKAQVLTTQRQLMRDPEVVRTLEEAAAGAKTVNGNGACRRGKPLGFPDQAAAAKMVVAVDVDEVLGSFLAALNKFIADRYSWNHSVSEYHVYEFFKIWNCSRERANYLVHEFFTTHYFEDGIHPIPGARDALQTLSSFCSLSVVTSRQDVIKSHTLEWIEKYYPGLFEQIHFGNHFALEGQSRPKSEICRSFGAQVLIDDNPRYALECANDGMRVLLFDYDNSYPWCKTGVDESHPLVTKVHNWEEVEEKLLSWVVPES